MSGFSQLEMQQAIYQLLSTDSTLSSLVTGVYDHVPAGTALPYITIGDATSRDWSTKTSSGSQLLFTIHAYSAEGGRKQVTDIMTRVYDLLHQGTLSLTSHTLVAVRFELGDIERERDGEIYHGRVRFRAYTEALASA